MCDLDWIYKYSHLMDPAERRRELDFLHVYLITDRSLLPANDFPQGLESALKGGIRSVQLREKDLAPAELLALACRVRDITQPYGAKLFINGDAEIADKAGADGVHLPETGAATAEVKKNFPHLLVGVSTHSPAAARKAEADGADFVTFSPIFDTPSKKQYGSPQGLDRLAEVTQNINIPVLALGGIKKDKVPQVLDKGTHGVALISGIWSSPDIEKESYQYMQYFSGVSS